MEMTERYVGNFYNHLAEDKLIGQRCRACGTYRLFPVPVCSNCQSTDMSWVELGKEGKLLFFAVSNMLPARYESYGPCATGCIQLKEGPVLWALVEGIDIKNPERELSRLPLDVHIEMREIAGNVIPIGKVQ